MGGECFVPNPAPPIRGSRSTHEAEPVRRRPTRPPRDAVPPVSSDAAHTGKAHTITTDEWGTWGQPEGPRIRTARSEVNRDLVVSQRAPSGQIEVPCATRRRAAACC